MTARFAVVAWAVSAAAMVRLLVHYPITGEGVGAVVTALVVSAVMFGVVVYRRIARRRPKVRVLADHTVS
ncbi:MAG: hypothetical protein LH616_16470 [Ilumatobacteraceae bacterium]|nr:hypothetical protein [Ilumatobacteraceae bacterium]